MSEHQKQTAFLRQCLRYDDSGERDKLEENIVQLQRNERCVRRAVWVMAWLVALAMVGLCYSAIVLMSHQIFSQGKFGRRARSSPTTAAYSHARPCPAETNPATVPGWSQGHFNLIQRTDQTTRTQFSVPSEFADFCSAAGLSHQTPSAQNRYS
jgi:hypothetical protein